MYILIRFSGEMIVKSPQVRSQFQKQLLRNIKDAFKAANIPMRLKPEWSRLFLSTEHPEAIKLLQQIFGIYSFSVIEAECKPLLDDIVATGLKHYLSYIANKTFAIKARRTGQQTFSSMDVQRDLGAALGDASKSKVNLSKPQATVYVEVRPDASYFYSESIKGARGLPLASGGKALCLISGGFDSAVAAWMLQKRGIQLDYLLCNLAGEAYERSVLKVAKHLADHWSFGHQPKLYVIDFQELASELKTKVTDRFVQVILKRLFYRAGEALAEKIKAAALVTGEAIGQVSSQTLANLKAIDEATYLPVLRPLVSFDKEDIINLSREIGTYALSASIQEFCQLLPAKPATACKVETAQAEEAKVDLALLRAAVAKVKVLNLRQLSATELTEPYIFRSDIPAAAVIVDCRSHYDYELGHFKNALHFEFYDLLEQFKKLNKKDSYLIYCAVGLQSAVVAEKMQAEGYLAYSFKGGFSAIKKLTE